MDTRTPDIQAVGIPAGANGRVVAVQTGGVMGAGKMQQGELRIADREQVVSPGNGQLCAACTMTVIAPVVAPADIMEHREEANDEKITPVLIRENQALLLYALPMIRPMNGHGLQDEVRRRPLPYQCPIERHSSLFTVCGPFFLLSRHFRICQTVPQHSLPSHTQGRTILPEEVAMLHPQYPTTHEVDAWCRQLVREALEITPTVRMLDAPVYDFRLGVRHHTGATYLEFTDGSGERFYGFWQPVFGGGPAPLLVHLPGYGAEISAHPEFVAAGYNVLHVNPLGYGTPSGPDETKVSDGNWPVLPDSVTTFGAEGYRPWLRQVVRAIHWASAQTCVQENRIGIFGTSQGGGTALLTASLLAGQGVKAVAADLPFLTGFAMHATKENRGAYELAFHVLDRLPSAQRDAAWRALGFVDTLCHAHRLTMPTLLTAGALDGVTPKDSIQSLFAALPATRSYTEFDGQDHAYTAPFLRLAQAWFTVYL